MRRGARCHDHVVNTIIWYEVLRDFVYERPGVLGKEYDRLFSMDFSDIPRRK